MNNKAEKEKDRNENSTPSETQRYDDGAFSIFNRSSPIGLEVTKMEVFDPATPWTAHDDLLLRTAIETGASLEALAKGAVQFSRRFTLKEVQDRWRSLLYDPCESRSAAFGMSEVENLNVGHASNLWKITGIKEGVEKSTKRERESIRKKYYAMRKRIRGPSINANDIDFINNSLYDNQRPVDQLMLTGSCLLRDPYKTDPRILEPMGGRESRDKLQADTVGMKMLSSSNLIPSDAGDICPEYIEQERQRFNSPISDGRVGLSSPTCSQPLCKLTKDVSAPVLHMSISPQDKTRNTETRSNLPVEDHDYMLNSANEGGLRFMDMDSSASADKSCYENLNSILLSSPNNLHRESSPCDNVYVTKDACLPQATSVVTSRNSLDMTTHPPECENSNHSVIGLDAVISSPSSVQKTSGLDNQDPDVPCLLNTEVEEVPSNDDIFLVEGVPVMHSISQNGYGKSSIIVDMKVDDPSQAVIVQGARPTSLLKSALNHDSKSSVKARFLGASIEDGKLLNNNQTVSDCAKGILQSCSGVKRALEGEAAHSEFKKPLTKFGQLALPGQISPPISPDEEEPESEEDVPYYSDVEAMVLEMDLCTSDQDHFTCARVSHYQDEDAKRKIVRLEQCARSCMDRRLKSLGAFAVLYGRRLKHYIKKPEVILGRATEDMEVDIDLAREGRANKISRQQARIRLETDGSFTVTNLGKLKISVNGMELESGQYMTLRLSNLIEIRDMSFIFEASHKLVQKFLASVRQSFQNQA